MSMNVWNVTPCSYSEASSETKIWLDNMKCGSNDTILLSCDHKGLGIETCGHSEDVALVCSTSSTEGSSKYPLHRQIKGALLLF